MNHFTPATLASALGAEYQGPQKHANDVISSYCYDSREAKPGCLFAAIKGENVDGFNYIDKAIEAGAICILCEREPKDGTPYILVPSVTEALIKAATIRRDEYEGTVIGITGSVGKTSTKEMIASVLSEHFEVHKTAGNHNNELGLPITMLEIPDEAEIAVIEMGISDYEEMDLLTSIARPNIAVITNIGVSHAEMMGTREGIFAAKSEIFRSMDEESFVILNGDDEYLSTLSDFENHEREINSKIPSNLPKSHPVVLPPVAPTFYGLKAEGHELLINDYYLDNVRSLGIKGTRFEAVGPYMSFNAHINTPGDHLLYAALASIAVADLLGLEEGEIIRGIHKYQPASGRTNVIKTESLTIIDDAYNASPDSMRAALDMLVSVDGRRVAILGDMYELGEMTNDAHRQMGEHAVDCGIETILCCGEYSALMEEAALKAADGYSEDFLIKYYPTLDELLFALPELLDDGDTVLVKASNGMNFKRVVAELIELGGDIIDDEDAEVSEDNSVVLELTDEEIASLMLNHDDCGLEHGDD